MPIPYPIPVDLMNPHAALFRALCLLLSLAPSLAWAAAVEHVPELASYTLVYELAVPTGATDFHSSGVPYAVDAHASVGPFNQVAYYLELQRPGLEPEWLWVSMDAFSTDAGSLGVPAAATAPVWQLAVHNLELRSNVAGLVPGPLATAWLEFWPHNYLTTNAALVAGADDASYDTGDEPVLPAAGYGSMQLHDPLHDTVLFAYNGWGNAAYAGDLGLGNAPGANTDWTFANNVGDYTVRLLQVYVRNDTGPRILLHSPVAYTMLQRNDNNEASILLSGEVLGASALEARFVPRSGLGGVATAWQPLPLSGGSFSAALSVRGGWYSLELRALEAGVVVASSSLGPVGVGELFVTAGQSNSANHGSPAQRVQDERVLAHDLVSSWRPAHDPQPIATGSGGSPWPLLGELLVARLEVPVGFVSVGWGGTSIAQWQPGGTLYPRLQGALQFFGPQGCRAVLWHQGESDNIADTSAASYASQLQTLIAQSRVDAGFALPWGVALVSFLSGYGVDPAVIAGQQQVIDQDPLTFLGPNTDELDAATYRFDGAHFNALGLQEHAQRWADALVVLLAVCNDGVCDADESCASCPGDCGDCCGDGRCDGSLGESPLSCASDCPAECGDGWCSHAEGCVDCPSDCGECPLDEAEAEADEAEAEPGHEVDAEAELSEAPLEMVESADLGEDLVTPLEALEELGELAPSADVEPSEQLDEALVGSGELQRAEGGCACQSGRPVKGSRLWLMGLACLLVVACARRRSHRPSDLSHR